jgi:hypothetical protein
VTPATVGAICLSSTLVNPDGGIGAGLTTVVPLDADHAQPVIAEAAADAGADDGLDQAVLMARWR